jgi:hypothetical protein
MAALAKAYQSFTDEEFAAVVDSGALDAFLAVVPAPGFVVQFLPPSKPIIN